MMTASSTAESASPAHILPRAVELHNAGRLEEACDLYAQVLAVCPEHPEANHFMGVALYRTGRIMEAIGRVAGALAFDPSMAEARRTLLKYLHEAFYIAEDHLAAGRFEDFLATYLRIMEARAASSCSLLLRQYFPLVATDSLLEALTRAEAVCRAVPALAATFDAVLLASMVHLEHGRIERGTETLLALGRAVPADAATQLRLGLLLLHYKRFTAAAALLRRAAVICDAPSAAAKAYHALGKAAYMAGDLADAERQLGRAVRLAPASHAALTDLGTVRLAADRAAEALRAFAAALCVHGSLPWSQLGCALGLTMLGRAADALASAEQLMAGTPDLIEAYIVAGSLLIDADAKRALDAFKTAINLRVGQQLSPVPPGPLLYECMRGYCDALHRTMAAEAPAGPLTPRPVTIDGEEYAEAVVRAGRLVPLASIPGDGRFHPRDPGGRILARRIGPPEVLPLTPPVNCPPDGEGRRFYGTTMFGWLKQAYRRFAWEAAHPFPRHTGSDGTFLSRIDDCRVVKGWLFSPDGDFHEESTVFDELAIFGQAAGTAGFKTEGVDHPSVRFLHPPTRFGTPHVVLTGYHAPHYGSWLLNLLPKFLLFDELEETRGLPIALTRDLYEGKRFVRETLDALGIGPERLTLLGNGSHEFATAWCVSAGAHILSPAGAHAIRARLLSAYGIDPGRRGGKLYYVSRRDAAVRRVLNEDRLIELLEAYGVEVVVNADRSMQELATLFADARCVIGVNGAGMTNTLFCPPGTAVVELSNDIMIEPLYWMLDNVLGFEHYVVVEHALNKRGDFAVSLPAVEAILRAVI
jgi:tetratricopeptide (TPR) repeat protein